MEDSFQFRQMQKLRSSLGPEFEEPEVLPEAPPAEEGEAPQDAWALDGVLEGVEGAGEPADEPEPRESVVARARAALQLVADLAARDPELAALMEEARQAQAEADLEEP